MKYTNPLRAFRYDSLFIYVILCLLLILGFTQMIRAEELPQTSPVVDPNGADPFVLKMEEGYLYTKTTGSDICLYRTDSILNLGAAEEYTIYRPNGALKDLWAPEIWKLDDGWYVYFAATVPGEEMHKMYVLENLSEDPLQGEWTCVPLGGMDDKFAIDGTVFELNENRYFIWSGWEGYENVRQDLYLAEMVSPTEVMEEKICLSVPEYSWETIGDPKINEGPEVLVRGETVNLVYSASGSWTDDYCLGLLTLPADADPKDPENWTKQDTPVLKREGDVYGPGHHCFAVSPDGTQDLVIYHAARWKGAGWIRNVRFGYPEFDASGKMLQMHPVSGEESIRVPSGTGEIRSLPLTDAALSEGLTLEDSGDPFISGRWKTNTSLTVSVSNDTDRDAVLALFVRTGKLRDGDLCTLGAKTSDETTAASVYAAENPQPVLLPVSLQAGENEIQIFLIAGKADLEITGIEIRL